MDPTIADLLGKLEIFRRLSVEDRSRLAEAAQQVEFAKGERIFLEGDASDILYTVVRGRVKVFKTTSAGSDVILEIFGPGAPIGAVAVFEGNPYPASAIAHQEAACLAIPRDTFFRLLEEHPSMVRGLLVSLTGRLMELTRRLAERTGGRVEQRLARFLLKLAEEMGRPTADGISIPLPLARQDLADLTGTTIETAIRVMSRWNKQGIVRTESGGFTILDRQALEEVASG